MLALSSPCTAGARGLQTHRVSSDGRRGQVSSDRADLSIRAGGLLISSEEGVIQIFPAINIKRSAVKKGLDILERSL